MHPVVKKNSGFTLIETIMLLAIGATFIVMALSVYQQWKQYTNTQYLSANVEQLFTAMRNYYQANCRQHRDAYGNTVSEGTLDPTSSLGSATKLALTVNNPSTPTANNDLTVTGFLSSTNWHPRNPLVDNAATDDGYYIQFNRIQNSNTDPTTSVFACPGDSTGPTTCTASTPRQLTSSATSVPTLQSRVVFWTAQVAVKVLNNTFDNVNALRAILGADCIVADPTKTCSTGANTSGSYLVWERPAAMLTQNTTSPLWMSLPRTKQFNMQYTNDGMSALSGVSSSSTSYNIQNYLCGE